MTTLGPLVKLVRLLVLLFCLDSGNVFSGPLMDRVRGEDGEESDDAGGLIEDGQGASVNKESENPILAPENGAKPKQKSIFKSVSGSVKNKAQKFKSFFRSIKQSNSKSIDK